MTTTCTLHLKSTSHTLKIKNMIDEVWNRNRNFIPKKANEEI